VRTGGRNDDGEDDAGDQGLDEGLDPRLIRQRLRAAKIKKVGDDLTWLLSRRSLADSPAHVPKKQKRRDWSKLKQLKKGDSFLIPIAQANSRKAIHQWGYRHGCMFTSRLTEDGKHYRVWRIA